jgi:preprotein translocase subunit SecG
MSIVLVVVHVVVCVFLIAVVLLQRGRGAEIGAVFGGGASSTVFGSRGAGNFLSKLTTWSAAVFMATSLGLSYVWTHASNEHLFDAESAAPPPAPAEKPLFEDLGKAPAADSGALPALPEPTAKTAPEPAEPAPAAPSAPAAP